MGLTVERGVGRFLGSVGRTVRGDGPSMGDEAVPQGSGELNRHGHGSVAAEPKVVDHRGSDEDALHLKRVGRVAVGGGLGPPIHDRHPTKHGYSGGIEHHHLVVGGPRWTMDVGCPQGTDVVLPKIVDLRHVGKDSIPRSRCQGMQNWNLKPAETPFPRK